MVTFFIDVMCTSILCILLCTFFLAYVSCLACNVFHYVSFLACVSYLVYHVFYLVCHVFYLFFLAYYVSCSIM